MPSVPKPTRTKRNFKRPAIKELVPLEDMEQQAVIHWLRIHRIRHTANVPDRRYCQRMGYSPGVPDILIFDRPVIVENGMVHVGCAIEMKRVKGGVVSPEQKEWIAALTDLGWLCTVSYGAEEAIKFLKNAYGK